MFPNIILHSESHKAKSEGGKKARRSVSHSGVAGTGSVKPEECQNIGHRGTELCPSCLFFPQLPITLLICPGFLKTIPSPIPSLWVIDMLLPTSQNNFFCQYMFKTLLKELFHFKMPLLSRDVTFCSHWYCLCHRTTESLRLKKTSEILQSNHQPTKAHPQVPHLHVSRTPPDRAADLHSGLR